MKHNWIFIFCLLLFSESLSAQNRGMSAQDMEKSIKELTAKVNYLSKRRPLIESRGKTKLQKVILNTSEYGEAYIGFPYIPKTNPAKLKAGSLMSVSVDGSTYKMTEEINDKKVVGVLIEEPIGKTGKKEYYIAMSGKVKVRVVCRNDDSKIMAGDPLVSSDAPGIAVKAKPADILSGCVIGKALEPFKNCYSEDVIMVLLNQR
ncbi:hypothetical protein [Spirosoma linguale]|uniref:Uncharacterized protein n=1 Tax=Spirosoma linguale (strain ATCC 33905 / DSM 74 / LMG 10896 / Claus 1) TaxID=504472 RepID=D2QTN0_SPILD|nr:hypothetical protein Slin_6203 [Spirosoma linguale DSM 74]